MSIEKENCTTCFHFKDNTCRNHGYYFKDHIAKRTRCDNWMKREEEEKPLGLGFGLGTMEGDD